MTVTVNSVLVDKPTSYGNTTGYRGNVVLLPNNVNAAGSGAGAAVSVPFVFTGLTLPSNLAYTVEAMPSQACAISWTSKSTTGFTVVLTPLTSGVTLSSGTFDVVVRFTE